MKSSRFGYRIIGTKDIDKMCPNCSKTTLEMSVIGRYVSFLYMPIMGTRKRVSIHCKSCDKIYTGLQIPHQMKEEAEAFKKVKRIPLWFNLGIILLGIGVLIRLYFRFFS